MKTFNPGAGFTIFIIFFGVAVMQAFRSLNWLMICFWLMMGVLFLYLDRKESSRK
jgi:hypothetical protein